MEIEQYQEPYVKLKVDDKVRSALLAQEPLLEADCYKMSNFAEPKNLEKLLTELITEEEAVCDLWNGCHDYYFNLIFYRIPYKNANNNIYINGMLYIYN